MNFTKYALGMFVFAGIISLIAGSGGNYFTQSVNAQSLGQQLGKALDETGEAASNATKTLGEAGKNATQSASQAANETGEAAGNATQSASQSVNNTASEAGQAADNATSGNSTNATESKNPLEMLMNLFKGNK
jgi:hypothetical protein